MYEVLLRGEDPEIVFGQQFWNEFFLLKPKVSNKQNIEISQGHILLIPLLPMRAK